MEIGAPVVTEEDLPDHELEFEGRWPKFIWKGASLKGKLFLLYFEIMEIGAPVVTEEDLPDHELEFEDE